MLPVLVGSLLYSRLEAPLLSLIGTLLTGVVVYLVRGTSMREAWALIARLNSRTNLTGDG